MKTCFVTGGSQGIGYAIAKAFSEKDYKVFVIDKNPTPYTFSPSIVFRQIDIRDEKELEAFAKDLPKIDVLVNNAAIQYEKPFKETSPSEFSEVIETNLTGTFMVSKILSKLMKNGLIINIGSVHSTLPRKNKLAYDVSKAGLSIMTKELALELADQGIRVNAIEFGAVDTPMNQKALSENKQGILDKVLMGHVFSPEEIATLVYALSEDKFRYMNGSIVVYDAGRSLK